MLKYSIFQLQQANFRYDDEYIIQIIIQKADFFSSCLQLVFRNTRAEEEDENKWAVYTVLF